MRSAILFLITFTVSFTGIKTWHKLKWGMSLKQSQSSISLLLELSLEINFLAIDIISLTPNVRK